MSSWLAQSLFYTGLVLISIGLVVVVVALFADAWKHRGRSKPVPRRCPKCWYDLRGLIAMRCPECGFASDDPARFFARRRRWGRAMLGALVMLLGAAGVVRH